VLVLKRIHVTYHLKLEDPDKREAAERVLGAHAKYCPVARSLAPAIDITTSLEIEDV
jgi:uncharacterized OsmC-like protein